MLEDHAKVIAVLKEAGEVIGRKKLQKVIYICKKLQFPFNEKYQFHFYGPYSEELTLRVEELCNLGLVTEVKESKGGYYQYKYSVTDEGSEFLSHYEFDMPELNECITEINGQSSRFLELVSTILFFDRLTKEEIIEKVRTIKSKQNYSDTEIDQAFTFMEKLGC
ncbi:YwgA family protein [Guptibacillus hwajinpoensis]|uniref:YwgA family protein n=1 Tax=Guptibacillus hwajinpoensis TaxID=208199 RepID=UPI00273C1BBD|nr:YwgA family protein [Alkalihalobacillus macyae]MDP4551500.1 YwgA family protein [Alkalihalobacillus macyae]